MLDITGHDDDAILELITARVLQVALHGERSQRALARCTGLDSSTLSKYRLGHRAPNYRVLMRILLAVSDELNLGWVVGPDGVPEGADRSPRDPGRDEVILADMVEHFGGTVKVCRILLALARDQPRPEPAPAVLAWEAPAAAEPDGAGPRADPPRRPVGRPPGPVRRPARELGPAAVPGPAVPAPAPARDDPGPGPGPDAAAEPVLMREGDHRPVGRPAGPASAPAGPRSPRPAWLAPVGPKRKGAKKAR